jgi:hypothetical protein
MVIQMSHHEEMRMTKNSSNKEFRQNSEWKSMTTTNSEKRPTIQIDELSMVIQMWHNQEMCMRKNSAKKEFQQNSEYKSMTTTNT